MTTQAPELSLTIVDVCDRLHRRLCWYGLPQLRTGLVMEKGDDTIVAFLTDQRDKRKVSLAFDRRTGHVAPAVAFDESPTPEDEPGVQTEDALALALHG